MIAYARDNGVSSDGDLLSRPLVNLLIKDINPYYGRNWSDLAEQNLPGSGSPLVIFEASRFRGKPCRCDKQRGSNRNQELCGGGGRRVSNDDKDCHCTKHGHNPSHDSEDCHTLKNRAEKRQRSVNQKMGKEEMHALFEKTWNKMLKVKAAKKRERLRPAEAGCRERSRPHRRYPGLPQGTSTGPGQGNTAPRKPPPFERGRT